MLTNCSHRPNSWEDCDARQSSSIRNGADNRRLLGCGKMDCGRAGWSVDFHFSPFASQRKEIGRIRGSFDGNPGIREWETQTTSDLGWRLQCEPVRYDRLFPCGRVDSKTKNAGGHERLTESESFTHDGDRTGLDGDEHVDERRHRTRAFHTIQLVKSRRFADTNGFHHDFEKIGNETCADTGLRLVQDGSQSGSCCPFVETENEIHVEERYEPAWLGARRSVAQCGCRDADGLGELECDGASVLVETAMAHRKVETKEMSVTEMELKITPVEKEENRTAPRANRVEFALPSNLEKAESAEARETPEQDQGECRDGESPQENAKQAFQLELDSKARKPRICSHKFLPRTLLDSNKPRRGNPIREATLGRTVEKPESGLCRRNVDLTKETGKCLEEVEKRERFTGSNHSRRFESIASRMFGEIGEIVVVDVLGYDFPGRLAVLYDGNGSESGGCNVLDQVQANAGLCAMRKVLGYVWLKSLPPLRYESVQTAFVPKTHADAGLFLLLKAAELSREWQREIVWYSWT